MTLETAETKTGTGGALMSGMLECLRPLVVEDLVRIGNRYDGGYIITERVIPSTEYLISFGVNEDWTFEEEFHRRNPACNIHAYDHTVSERHFRRQVRKALERCLLLKSGGYRTFRKYSKIHREFKEFFSGNRIHFPERIYNRAENASDATIEKVFSRINGAPRVAVKMDIEGAEYRVIGPLLEYEDRIDLMVIEFHDTEPLRQTFLSNINQLLRSYHIVHLHGNNAGGVAQDGFPELAEVTFLSRRFQVPPVYRKELPLGGIDAPNFPRKQDFKLRFSQGT
ncbi:MAG TPA: FkbM family methyltransferase [Candidatus Cybelea sp.]|nr:FkbM family methyltransferase [Candidatus Cybelea sp.]